MTNRVSKKLEAAFAIATFDLKRSETESSYDDHLSLIILRDITSLASQHLLKHLQEWELLQLSDKIEHLIKEQPFTEVLSPEDHFHNVRNFLIEQIDSSEEKITTLHALHYIASNTSTATSQALAHYGITSHSLIASLPAIGFENNQLSFGTIHITDNDKKTVSVIEKYSTDLTTIAAQQGLDPVIGREREIERVIQILCRRKKNNPILIGEAGVGKSAIVEALAQAIVANKVPAALLNKKIYSLDIASLIAGTKYRGEFEERMQRLLQELQQRRDIILFIDEIHTIAGAGATQGTLDVANIIKPALARGEIRLIGATTIAEYRRHIESDAALERRFQRITIDSPSHEETLNILQHIAPHYEKHHNVKYTMDALIACVELSHRYITDRNMPDKAIDVMDEAGAISHTVSNNNTQIEIGRTEIEQVITQSTGIPTTQLSIDERDRLRSLPHHLQQRIVGQREAIDRLVRTLKLVKSGLKRNDRPIGVFMFIGQTGVGKTLLAKELSAWLFSHNQGLIRIDMSEYGERHNVSRLIGSPPGYVGYGEGGQLTEAVRRQPHGIVLFDEVEKAHPDVLNTMLQIFDEGHLTDGCGRKVDFRNTIIILTSNIGSRDIAERNRAIAGFDTPSKHNNQEQRNTTVYRQALEKGFSPEFLNRIDEVIYFRSLDKDDAVQILEIELSNLHQRSQKLGIAIEVSNEVKHHLAKIGFEERYGARALRRTLQSHIEEPLSAMIVEGLVSRDGRVIIEMADEDITLRVA